MELVSSLPEGQSPPAMPVPADYKRPTPHSMDLLVLSHFPQVCRAAQMAHLDQNPLLLPRHKTRRSLDVPVHRIRQHGREECRLARTQARGGLVIELAGCGLDSVYAAAELRDVEVHLEDALFRPQRLELHGEVGLDPFTHEVAARPEKEVPRHLLRDGARAAQSPAALGRAHRAANG